MFNSRKFWILMLIGGGVALYATAVVWMMEFNREAEIKQAEFEKREENEIRIGANNLVTEIKIPACTDGWSIPVGIGNWNISWSFKARFEYKHRVSDKHWREPTPEGRFLGEVVRFCFERDQARLAGRWQKLNYSRPNPHRPGWIAVRGCNHDFGNRWSDEIKTNQAKAKRVEWPKRWQIWVNRLDWKKRDWLDWRADFLDVSQASRERWGDGFRVCTDNKSLAGYAMPLTWID